MKEKITKNYLETIEFGNKVGSLLSSGDVILLAGDLGAGKTTFTKGIGQALGIKRVINSPTFTIVKEYHGNLDLYHLDLYRLDGLGSDFDLEEYFEKDGIVVCCGKDAIKIITVKPEGKGEMQASAWANGARIKKGAKFI